ncbi:AAA family ATPase [Vibrio astriarenae]|uniref:AAA family ATPase n=1 Tax=Vibrio astriarenae TaxID=1481923 RepID=A0A7Z2T4N1_9VIBR|nr:helicase RepA family protein [Vibrio astriarenae]QIA64333.1 AAA family ATPase [Vibrio astriarenae]
MKHEQLDLFGELGFAKQSTNQLQRFGKLKFSIGSTGYDSPFNWAVKDLIPALGFGVIYGPSGSLKSFLAIDLCCSIASGKSWLGKTTTSGPVVYVAAEGQLGVSRRIKAWELANETTADNVFVLPQNMFISERNAQDELIEAIQEIEAFTQQKVQLVVIDTLSRCFIGDENTSRDMTSFIQGCDRVKAETQSGVLCIHHCGRDESKGARGSSALRAACDYEFQTKRNGKTKLLKFVNTKQKEGEEAPDLELEFDTVELGLTCEDNKPITSLARLKEPTIKNTMEAEPDHPILKILGETFGGRAKRVDLRQAIYPTDSKPTAAQRKSLSRSIAKLQESGRISVEQESPSRASDKDIISLAH